MRTGLTIIRGESPEKESDVSSKVLLSFYVVNAYTISLLLWNLSAHSVQRKRPAKRVVYADASSSDESTGAKVIVYGKI
jgi:hypothetical protein